MIELETELEKARNDLILYGSSFMKDGKHVPLTSVQLKTIPGAKTMTDSTDKALHNQLQADGYHPSGEIWRNQSGEVALIELGVVRKMTLDEMFELMHADMIKKQDQEDEAIAADRLSKITDDTVFLTYEQVFKDVL